MFASLRRNSSNRGGSFFPAFMMKTGTDVVRRSWGGCVQRYRLNDFCMTIGSNVNLRIVSLTLTLSVPSLHLCTSVRVCVCVCLPLYVCQCVCVCVCVRARARARHKLCLSICLPYVCLFNVCASGQIFWENKAKNEAE